MINCRVASVGGIKNFVLYLSGFAQKVVVIDVVHTDVSVSCGIAYVDFYHRYTLSERIAVFIYPLVEIQRFSCISENI